MRVQAVRAASALIRDRDTRGRARLPRPADRRVHADHRAPVRVPVAGVVGRALPRAPERRHAPAHAELAARVLEAALRIARGRGGDARLGPGGDPGVTGHRSAQLAVGADEDGAAGPGRRRRRRHRRCQTDGEGEDEAAQCGGRSDAAGGARCATAIGAAHGASFRGAPAPPGSRRAVAALTSLRVAAPRQRFRNSVGARERFATSNEGATFARDPRKDRVASGASAPTATARTPPRARAPRKPRSGR